MPCQANDHRSSQAQMWNMHCGSGSSKWSGGESLSIVGCSLKSENIYFEEALDVPEDERLTGSGWVQKFCNA